MRNWLGLVLLSWSVVVSGASAVLRGAVEVDKNTTEWAWETRDSKVFLNDNEVHLRGLSWFGFETQDFVINGLWSHPMTWYFDLLSGLGINAIRLPFSAEWIYYNFEKYPYDGLVSADPESQHQQSIAILDRFFDEAESHGIVVLLDLHRLHKEYISELWYSPTDQEYTTDTFYSTWFRILDRYKDRPNLMGIDLLNEPHGQATFGSNNPSNDWRLFVQSALPKISERYSDKRWLYFVEGIEWGHTFRDYASHPFDLPESIQKQIVFSPHVYGKSVVWSTPTDPTILRHLWENDYGYLIDMGKTVIPGEWGGQTNLDAGWMNMFADYLLDKKSNNNFLWSLGPNSGDVAGLLLENWTDLDAFKVALLHRLMPDPTRFSFR